MAALAESLVDEWLNRQGFFTVRGLKHGVDEIDLLGVRPSSAGCEAWHVEVQASFRPIGYISPLLSAHVPAFARSKKSARQRPSHIIAECAASWVQGKFLRQSKKKARDSAWPGLDWKLVFVHAVVKDQKELDQIAAEGVKVLPLHYVLANLRHRAGRLKGGAGTDLAELIEYYNEHVEER